jgi:hypothetical protein
MMIQLWPVLVAAAIASVMLGAMLFVEQRWLSDLLLGGSVAVLIAGQITTRLWLRRSLRQKADED